MTKAYSFTRMSTPAQLKGDSLRRQLAKAERWAEKHGVPLDTSLRAIGVSAFKGMHRTKGALAGFLGMIKDGQVASNDYLIVENVDRLSRENPWDALGLMREIINAGVIIVSLIDDMEYSLTTLRNRPEAMSTLQAALTKGHRESRDKADRLQEVWNEKRVRIEAGGRKKLTRQGPGWFRLTSNDPAEPLVGDWIFTDHLITGRMIFQMCIDGLGKEAIARKLNALGLPTFKGGDGWQSSTVLLLLRDRRAIGELQLYTAHGEGGRRPIGEPIKGYFATASGETLVTEDTFYLAQAALSKRHCGAGVGRLGKVPNVFIGLGKCQCGRAMEYKNKLASTYLICSGAQRGHACANRHRYAYSQTEALVLDWVTDIQVPDDETHRAGVAALKVFAKIAERDDHERRFREAMEEWGTATIGPVKSRLMKMAEHSARELEATDAEIVELRHIVKTTNRSVLDDRRATVSRVREEMEKLDGEALFETRAKVAAALRQVIDHVEFETDDRFTVFLHGSLKAYRFASGKFSHAIDVESSTWLRLPTAAQKKVLATTSVRQESLVSF